MTFFLLPLLPSWGLTPSPLSLPHKTGPAPETFQKLLRLLKATYAYFRTASRVTWYSENSPPQPERLETAIY